MHTASGRWKLGLVLTLLVVLLWGLLPIVLKALLQGMDAFTITWYRFLAAAALLAILVRRRRGLHSWRQFRRTGVGLLAAGCVGLCGNYIFYLLGLKFLTPSTAQVVIQLAPMFLVLGGVVIYREHYSWMQWTGLGTLILGLVLFFNRGLIDLVTRFDAYTGGVLLIIAAAVTWAAYGLAQKQLLKSFSSEAILFMIFSFGAAAFLPLAEPKALLHLSTVHLLLLIFSALNTLFAYGCFAEALNHWEASRVSAVLATVPLMTMAFVQIFSRVVPQLVPREELTALSLSGAVLVVLGSMTSALGRKRRAAERL
ncbi:MAG: EamA family transporter [Candidatus Eisenbacteria bacterium]|nr:EamA family transporter [Candidatus Eisenbacteria bacterium]